MIMRSKKLRKRNLILRGKYRTNLKLDCAANRLKIMKYFSRRRAITQSNARITLIKIRMNFSKRLKLRLNKIKAPSDDVIHDEHEKVFQEFIENNSFLSRLNIGQRKEFRVCFEKFRYELIKIERRSLKRDSALCYE
jgi:hypothetical protein